MGPGDAVGPYVLVRPLGSGGSATVWLARSAVDAGEVAIKILDPQALEERAPRRGPSLLERFLEEGRLLERLRDPGLVRVLEVIDDRAEGTVALVMERLLGRDLARAAEDIAFTDLLEVFRQIADTLARLHEEGIIHRDVKPANVHVAWQRGGGVRARLLDLGIAKDLLSADRNSTATGMLVGTIFAMAPEVLRRAIGHEAELDSAVDQWSLGIALYFCLCGSYPFTAPDTIELIERIEHAPTPQLRLCQRYAEFAELLPALDRIVRRCLEKSPSDRYRSASAIADDLRDVQSQLQAAALERPSSEREARARDPTRPSQRPPLDDSEAAADTLRDGAVDVELVRTAVVQSTTSRTVVPTTVISGDVEGRTDVEPDRERTTAPLLASPWKSLRGDAPTPPPLRDTQPVQPRMEVWAPAKPRPDSAVPEAQPRAVWIAIAATTLLVGLGLGYLIWGR